MKHLIGRTHNHTEVYVNLIGSLAGASIARQPRLLALIKDVIRQTDISGDHLRFDRDMGKAVGYSYVVETGEQDNVVYARRVHDSIFTRFVRHGTPKVTQYVSLVLQKDADGKYELQDAWIGPLCPPRPGAELASDQSASRSFWANHAWLLNDEPVQPRTLTKVCPY